MKTAFKWPPGQPTLKSRVADTSRPYAGGTVIEDGPQVVAVRWDEPEPWTPRVQYCPVTWLQPYEGK
jgi:hypothetical protein